MLIIVSLTPKLFFLFFILKIILIFYILFFFIYMYMRIYRFGVNIISINNIFII